MAAANPKIASSEAVREVNRRIVLNLIRTRQPISRADLARQSGMQRSTISLIVEELVHQHWVVEGPTGRLPRGRRPTFLRLNDNRLIIGVDIRPMQTTLALADVNGRLNSHKTIATPPDSKIAIKALIQEIRALIASAGARKIEGIGVSLPGRVDPVSGRLVFAPNLRWGDVDVARPIADATGLDVEMDNAANACVLAAAWFERLESRRNIVVVTISEGIGTGVWINGQLVRGLRGMAGEFGHAPLDPSGPRCSCGNRGCWEVFASNRAGLRYYHESSSQANSLTFLDLLSLADQGDSKAIQALNTMANYLGRGMRMIVAGLAPEQIMVIGDLTRSWKRFGPVIEAEVKAQTLMGGAAPQVVPVHEYGTARLQGTFALVLQKHFSTI